MNVSDPLSSVVPGVQGVVLSALSRTFVPLTGRQVASLVAGRAGQARVNHVLQHLTEEGLAVRLPAGPSYLYTLNRDHLAAEAITALARMGERLLERIAAEVETWQVPCEALWLFGSASRRDGTSASDIDLLVLRAAAVGSDDEPWASQLDRLSEKVRDWTGNPCEVVDHDRAGLLTLAADGDRFVDELRSQAVTIVGPDVRTVLRPARAPA